MILHYTLKRLKYTAGKLHGRILSLKRNVEIGKGAIVEPGVVIRSHVGGKIE